MAAAEVSFTATLKECALDTIVRNIEVNYRPWAPRLALLLAGTPGWGEEFASELAERLNEDLLFDKMVHSRRLDSLNSFHDLGRYLQPRVAERFDEEAVRSAVGALYMSERPEVTLRAASAIAMTMRHAGVPKPGESVVRKIAQDWTWRLTAAGTPGDLAESLRILSGLDRAVARVAVQSQDLRRYLRRLLERTLGRARVLVELIDAIEEAAPGDGRQLLGELQSTKGSWDAAMEDLAYEQDPRLQGDAFLRFAELGAVPPDRIQTRVFNRWLAQIATITSAAALTSLLRAFAAWSEDKAKEAASRLNTDRVARRIAEAARYDLDAIGGLIGTLNALGFREQALRFVAPLKQVDNLVTRAGLNRAATWLATLRSLDPSFARLIAIDCRDAARRRAGQRFVLEDIVQWLDIGWAAYWTRSLGQVVEVSERPWTFDIPKPPHIWTWGAAWLADHHWTLEAVYDGLARVAEAEQAPLRDWAAAAMLTVASGRDQVDGLVGRSRERWQHAADAEPLHLVPLLEARRRDLKLRKVLEPTIQRLHERVKAPHMRAHPLKPVLAQLLQD